ncbi:hypothetical protein [Cellulomonas hominis]
MAPDSIAHTPAVVSPGSSDPRGPVPQLRRLVTELPGPRSRELATRRAASVAAGVSSTLPVYVARAAGAVLEDVDGNLLVSTTREN